MSQGGELTLTFKHSLYYSNRGAIPAHEVAEALLALDRIVARTPRVLQQIAGGSAPKVALFVERLEEGSLTEDIIVQMFFGSKQKMNRTLKRWREKLGVDVTKTPGMIRAIIIALILVGAYKAASIALGPDGKPSVEIKDNIIINVGADMKMTGDELVQLVDKVVTRKMPLAQDAAKVILPAKRDPEASIQFDGDKALTIPPALIKKVPEEVKADEATDSETIEHAEIHLRALDLDNSEHGWAAVISAKSQRRLKLELAPTIKPDDLFGKRTIKGTVEAISKKDAHGRMQLKSYRLVSIDSEKAGAK